MDQRDVRYLYDRFLALLARAMRLNMHPEELVDDLAKDRVDKV